MSKTSKKNRRTYTNLLVEALAHLHGSGDVHSSLVEFLKDVQKLFNASGVLWWEYNQEEDTLKLVSFAGPFSKECTELTIPASEGLTGAVLKSGDSQVLEGPAVSDNLPAEIGSVTGVESALGVRVGSDARLLGVLISLFPSAASLALQQMETMELLASALGSALEGSLLQWELQEQFQRLLLLQDLSRILQSNQSMGERLERLVSTLCEAFNARFGYILLADDKNEKLKFRAASGIELRELADLKIEPGRGIAGQVFLTGESRLVPDVSKDPDYVERHTDVLSEMAVPIEAEGKVLGILNFESDQPGCFDAEDLRLAGIIASHTGVTLHNALSYDSAMTRMRELELLNRVTQVIAITDDVEELLQALVLEIHSFMDAKVVGILLVDDNGVDMRVHASSGGQEDTLAGLKLQVGKGVTGDAALTGQTQYVPDVTRDNRYVPIDPTIRSELAVPLVNKGIVIGVLNLEADVQNHFSEEDQRVVEIMAAQISQILAKALLYDELATMAVTDGLTGLFNHRQFFVRLEAEFKRAIRYSYPLSLIMLDIDYFKNFNDTHGHLKGDEVLREIAKIITRTMRETDVVARYGGEEFAAILPLCHESTAVEVAERLRRSIEEARLGGNDNTAPITVSLGICTAPEHSSTHEELVRRADDAMYTSKRNGRNQCTLWQPDLA